jgi:hypothetical protein
MSLIINVPLDVGDTIYYIAPCSSNWTDVNPLTIFTDVVVDVSVVVKPDPNNVSVNVTEIKYLVTRGEVSQYAKGEDSFATLSDAISELENRLFVTPQ